MTRSAPVNAKAGPCVQTNGIAFVTVGSPISVSDGRSRRTNQPRARVQPENGSKALGIERGLNRLNKDRGSMTTPNHRGPKALSDVLSDLFTARGFARVRARQELEEAWANAVGEAQSRQTRLGEARAGILNVTVASSALLAELAGFQKPALLAALRAAAPGTPIEDIRFRVGVVASANSAASDAGSPRRPGRS